VFAAGNGGNRDQRDGQIAVVKLFLDKGRAAAIIHFVAKFAAGSL